MSRSMNTWSCARCGTSAFADQNFCRKCGTPREGRRQAPITAQVPIIRTGTTTGVGAQKPDESVEDAAAPRPRRPGRRPISLAALLLIALVFLALGGIGAIIVRNSTDQPSDSPTTTTSPRPSASSVSDSVVTTSG